MSHLETLFSVCEVCHKYTTGSLRFHHNQGMCRDCYLLAVFKTELTKREG